MDGVLVDSEPLWAEAIRRQFKKRGIVFSSAKKYTAFVDHYLRGRTQRDGYWHTKKLFRLKAGYPEILQERLKILFRLFHKKLRPLPGALALVKACHDQKLPLVLASSSPVPVISFVVKKFHLKKYFLRSLSGDNCRHSKPHPEIFLKAAKLLRQQPKNILVIEDSISGILAAKRAGMKCIALKQSYTALKYLRKADCVVKNLKQVNSRLLHSL